METIIPQDFAFSQGNLQDYYDCQRRFQLRYMLGIKWPELVAEPFKEVESSLRNGYQFHNLLHQHLVGNDENTLGTMAEQAGLLEWWQSYLNLYKSTLVQFPRRFPEVVLVDDLKGFRLLARYDLLVVHEGGLDIYDWKTARSKPSRQVLARRWQTKVYPYLAVRSGEQIVGSPVSESQVRLVYWYAQNPDSPDIFAYDHEQYLQDERDLHNLVDDLLSPDHEDFPKTEDSRNCKFCAYRALCNRGSSTSSPMFLMDELEFDDVLHARFDLDFNSIAEIDA